MPQIVPALVGAVGLTGVAGALVTAGIQLAISYALSRINQPKGPEPKDLQTELRQADAPMVRHLGAVKVSGAVMYWDWKYVSSKRRLWKLVAVGAGGMNGILGWWLNDRLVSVTGTAVTTAPFAGYITLDWRKGRDDQPNGGAYPALTASEPAWTANHRLAEVGTILAGFDWPDGSIAQDVYPGGEPQVMVLIQGDSVRHPDGVTIGHSTNLARQLYDILVHPKWGCCTPADLYLGSWTTAVADCAEGVPVKAGGTLPRYHGGGSYELREAVKDVAQRWLDGMAGQLYLTTDGLIGVRAGKWRAPAFTITEDKIVSMEYGAGTGDFEVVTTLSPKYVAPEAYWQETSADPWDDPIAIARYGEVVPKTLELPVVRHHGQARRVAKIKAARINAAMRMTIRLRAWGLLLMEEEAVYVTIPRLLLNAQPFWIESFGADLDDEGGVVTVSLIAARPASFDWNAETEEGSAPESSTPTPPNATETPAGVMVTSTEVVTVDGGPFIRHTFTVPQGRRAIFQNRRTGTTDPWTTMTMEGQGGSVRSMPLQDGTEYDVRYGLRQRDFYEAVDGAWTMITGIEVVANGTPPDPPTIISTSGAAGGPFSITFAPDLGVNYGLTELWRGGPNTAFVAATKMATSYATSAEVTFSGTVPAGGACYWLVSRNKSNVGSTPIIARNIPA